MLRKCMIFLFVAVFTLFCGATLKAQDKATPEEVIQKVREAAKFLAEKKEAGLDEFNKKDGKWVWKDTYVFVFNCDEGKIVAHPIKPQLIGKNLIGLKDVKGNLFFVQLCEAAKNPKGGWVEYWWPKPGEKTPSRKITFMIKVEGTPYQVGAGVYDDTISVDELNKLLE